MFKFFNNILRKSTTFGPITKYYRHRPIWTPKEFIRLADEGYRNNIYVYSCVKKIAQSCAGIPWLLYKKPTTKNGKIEEIENHPLLDLWNNPNPMQSREQFVENAIAYLMIAGNSYIEQIKLNNLPKEIYTLRPDRMVIIPGDSKRYVKGYVYVVGNDKATFQAEDILHLLMFDPLNDWLGMSPLYAASQSLDQNNASRAWNVSLLQNGGQPSGVLKTHPQTKSLTDQQFNRLTKKWQERYSGADSAGLPIILEGGLDWQSLSMTAQDMAWVEGIKMSAKEIAIAYGVPPELLGDTSNKTYNNYKEARKAFYEETILPLMDWFRGEINGFLTDQYDENLYLDYDKDGIEALQEDREALWQRIDNSTELTINEKRLAKGYEEIPENEGGNAILVDSRKMPLTSLLDITSDDDVDDDKNIDDIIQEEFGNPEFKKNEDSINLLKTKSVGLKTKAAKEQYVEAFDIARNPFYKGAAKVSATQFDKERKAIKKIFKNNDTKSIAKEINKYLTSRRKEWTKALDVIYKTTVPTFIDFILESVANEKSMFGIRFTKNQDDWRAIVNEYLKNNSSDKVKAITDTTKKQIRKELSEGVENEESIEELAKRIDTLFLDQIIPNRSTVIARTEVVSASNLGSRIGAKQSGYDMRKEWLATNDSRTRNPHRRALGQTKDLDKPYIVNGQKLMFPGDTSLGATPDNTIQCRCTETYEIKD